MEGNLYDISVTPNEYWDEDDLIFFKNKLLKMREELLSESENTIHDMKSENTLFPDPNDRASLETDRNTVLRIRDRERKLLIKVEKAIERIAEGTFGICEISGEPIERKRLEARPVTTLSLACKEEQERKEKQNKR